MVADQISRREADMTRRAVPKEKSPSSTASPRTATWSIRRGNRLYYVIDAQTGGMVGGPYSMRDQAQTRADTLNSTVLKARR